MLIHELDTPALVCNLDKLERNIRDMAARCRQLDIPLHCHIKSHKQIATAPVASAVRNWARPK